MAFISNIPGVAAQQEQFPHYNVVGLGSQTSINDLPQEVLSLIFSRSLPKDVASCARVDKAWENLTSDESLWANSLACEAVERWSKHFGSVGKVPPLPPDIVTILKSPCPFWEGKKVWETHWLMLIPDTVNGKPLTLNSLEELAKQKGPDNKFDCFSDQARTEHGDTTIESHWVLMTKDVIPGSRNKSYKDLCALLENKVGYEMPGLLEATCCIFMEHAISGAYPFALSSLTLTCCKETTRGLQLAAGGFDPDDGLCVCYLCVGSFVGLAGLRKL